MLGRIRLRLDGAGLVRVAGGRGGGNYGYGFGERGGGNVCEGWGAIGKGVGCLGGMTGDEVFIFFFHLLSKLTAYHTI